MQPPEFLKPLVELLPDGVQGFVNSGGWLLGAALLLGLVLAILLAVVRGLVGGGRGKAYRPQVDLIEDLSSYPPPPALWGDERLTLYGLPVRMRLVVAAPLGLEAGELRANQVEGLLDQVVHGLGKLVRSDKPRVRVWPMQLSHQGFTVAFRRHTLTPEERGPSRWVLLMGRVFMDRRPMVLGLAFLANQDNTLGRITLEHPHQWMEALRFQRTS